MTLYYHSVELPFSKKNIRFRELTTDDQLSLGKANYSFSNDIANYFSFVYNIVEGCVENVEDFKNIDFVEFILFVIKLRVISVGPNIELAAEVDGEKVKITVNLNILLKNVYSAVDKPFYDISHKNLNIKMGLPYIKDFSNFLLLNPKNLLDVIETLHFYIKSVDRFDFEKLNSQERKILFDHFPVSLTKEIQTQAFEIIEKLGEKEIFGIELLKQFRINFYNKNFIELIKFLCSYDVKGIHRDIFLLSSLDPFYIKTLSPSERNIYISLYMESKSSGKYNGEKTENANLSPLERLALEFGQKPINT